MVPLGEEFAHYARPDFTPGRPILEAAAALMERIHAEFDFNPAATDVATPVSEVMTKKAGVCQDFAHLMLACLRSLGLPARYVSGYLETRPPEGQQRLTGADASHAWVSIFCGETAGWVDADPTNNLLPGMRHITVAWGRDYSDVSPLRGVTLGAGGKRLSVAVDVVPDGDLASKPRQHQRTAYPCLLAEFRWNDIRLAVHRREIAARQFPNEHGGLFVKPLRMRNPATDDHPLRR